MTDYLTHHRHPNKLFAWIDLEVLMFTVPRAGHGARKAEMRGIWWQGYLLAQIKHSRLSRATGPQASLDALVSHESKSKNPRRLRNLRQGPPQLVGKTTSSSSIYVYDRSKCCAEENEGEGSKGRGSGGMVWERVIDDEDDCHTYELGTQGPTQSWRWA